MADLSQVEDRLVTLITSAIYPNGTDADSILGTGCRIYRGWPASAALNADLQSGLVNVTVAPDTDQGRATTRYRLDWVGSQSPATLAATVAGDSVMFSGTATARHAVGLLIDGRPFAYPVRDTDDPGVVAASLAAMIRTVRVAHLNGTMITVPGATTLIARIVTSGTSFREARRQERDLRVICWCPSPSTRDATATAIDQTLVRHDFLDLADESHARLQYRGTAVYDQAQNALLYRRDLIYTTEYPTIIADTLPAMLFGHLKLNSAEFTA